MEHSLNAPVAGRAGAETIGAIDEYLQILNLDHELEEILDYEVEPRDNIRRAALPMPKLHEAERKI